MKSLDMKLRYGITIVTALLFLLAVKSSFGQNAENRNVHIYSDSVSQNIQNNLLIDPLSPSILNATTKDQKNNTENVTFSNGRMVIVDTEGVQSLAIPVNNATLPDKRKVDLNHNEK